MMHPLLPGAGDRCRQIMLALIALFGLSAQSYGPAELDESFSKATFVVSASSLACYRFDLWIARERWQQRRGLMFVRDMPADAGMLFVYDSPARLSMWMKNTFIALDMLFIREDGRISSIVADTEPLSLRSVAATEAVSYVLELNAGVTAALGIVPGDRLVF
jgi:uncharacterized membrane protein (UPF0127 family)